LLAEAIANARARGRRRRITVELAKELRDLPVNPENGPPRRLGRMRRQHELHRRVASRLAEVAEALLGIGERLGWETPLALVLRPSPDAVVLLGDVRELEVDREGAQDERLLAQVETGDERDELPHRLSGTAAPGPRELARTLLELENTRPLLFDDDGAERVSEQPNIAPEWVGH